MAGIAIEEGREPDAFEKNLMLAIVDECGLVLEKELLGQEKHRVEEQAQQEALRANLLRAISHDLRTPLTAISGNAGILMENASVLDAAKRRQLYTSIYDDSMWLANLVENLLSVSRIENGTIRLKMEPELLEEVFQEALTHLDRKAKEHTITVELPDDMLMAKMDARLIVQVVINIVNNAIKYTPPPPMSRCPPGSGERAWRCASPTTAPASRTRPRPSCSTCFTQPTTPGATDGGAWAWACPCAAPSCRPTAAPSPWRTTIPRALSSALHYHLRR